MLYSVIKHCYSILCIESKWKDCYVHLVTFHTAASFVFVSPLQLKDDVCSPAGTSIQAVRTMEKAGFRGIVMDAVHAASKRALELSRLENGEAKDIYVKR